MRGLACLAIAMTAGLSLSPRLAVPEAAPAHTDLVLHLLLYGGMALPARLGWTAWPRTGLAVLIGLAVAFEAGQILVPGRSFALADLAMNLAGTGLGFWAAPALWRRVGRGARA